MTENQISYLIRGAIFEVYNELGPGLFESVYQKVHHKQVLTYLKLTDLKLGILVNFNSDNIATSIHRKVNRL